MKPLSVSEQRLREAITSCRIYQTKQLLETGTPAEFVDNEGLTPLLRTIRLGDEKHRTRSSLIKLLLQYGANVNAKDPEGRHVLTFACMAQKQELIRLLLDIAIHDIDLNLKDKEGNTPLMHAVKVGNVDIVRVLVDSLNRFQIDMDVRNDEDRTPYLEAKRLGMEECAGILLNEGHASRNIQVNPFLDFMDNIMDASTKGEVRSVDVPDRRNSSRARCLLKTSHKGKQRHSLVGRAVNGAKQESKRLLKRKASSPKGLKIENQENLVSLQEENPNSLGDLENGIKNRNSEEFGNEAKEPELAKLGATPTPRPLSGRSDVTSATLISVAEPPVHATHRPYTVAHSRNSKTQKTFITAGYTETDNAQSILRNTRARHQRAKTAPHNKTFEERRLSNVRSSVMSGMTRTSVPFPPRSSVLSNSKLTQGVVDDMGDFERVSWYSHFSINTSPSVAFIHRMMSLYAEQHCPESSYRTGYKFVPSEVPSESCSTPDSEPDRQSIDGRRSSSGTIRSLHSVQGGRNRKFSSITRSISPFLQTSSRKAGSSASSRTRASQLTT